MDINPSIFKAYDIRGKVPAEITEAVALQIGRSAAAYFIKKARKPHPAILLCRDVRASSESLAAALAEGIRSQGADVLDGGVSTTPFFYFLIHTTKLDGAVMVTASHNPPEYNGFKIRDSKGGAVSLGSGLERIRDHAMRFRDKPSGRTKAQGKTGALPDMRDAYIDTLAKGAGIGKIKIVLDAAGGSTTLFLPKLLSRFPSVSARTLFFETDGTFRRHDPNPLLPQAQQFAQKELRKGGYRFGAVFDGDGDRVNFFDEKGNLVNPEFVFLLSALAELEARPKSVFALPVDTSRIVEREIRAHGGSVAWCRRGYTFVKKAMQESGAALGVERSGHFFFKSFSYDDSALLAWVRLAGLISRARKPFSSLIKPYVQSAVSGEASLPLKDGKTEVLLAGVRDYYKKAGARLSFLDGVKVEFPDWWVNVRPSNTEPLVRVALEAKTKKLFRQKLKEIGSIIERKKATVG